MRCLAVQLVQINYNIPCCCGLPALHIGAALLPVLLNPRLPALLPLPRPLTADGRYQVFILAYNKYGYTRSEGSNVFTVGAPSANPLSITARDGDGKITVSFTTPDVSALVSAVRLYTHCV